MKQRIAWTFLGFAKKSTSKSKLAKKSKKTLCQDTNMETESGKRITKTKLETEATGYSIEATNTEAAPTTPNGKNSSKQYSPSVKLSYHHFDNTHKQENKLI